MIGWITTHLYAIFLFLGVHPPFLGKKIIVVVTMSVQPNDLIHTMVESIKSTFKEANMLGFDSYAEQTIAFFEAV